jgi:alpha-N-acetylglucosaminidase
MLAPVGTELVWYNTLLKLGYTDAEAKAFIPVLLHGMVAYGKS